MILYVYILISLLLLVWVAEPLLRQALDSGNVTDLERDERTQSLLTSLKNLYDSRGEGDGPDDDFQNIERRLMLELAHVYKASGIDPGGSVPSQNDDLCECGTALGADYQFCPACGRQNQAA